jgi:L-iditol 2-dehydrogenase
MEIKKMRFAVLTKKGNAEIHERDLPEVGEGQVLVKHEACNICTTDYGQWMGLREHQGYPMAGGHEWSGIVVKKGKNVLSDIGIGDRVAMTYSYCGQCDPCRKGITSECINVKNEATEDGYLGAFGYADYSVRDAKVLMKMNPELDASEAAFLEPLTTVVKGLEKLRVKPFETIVVIGAGTMGLLNAQAARAHGARVIITEIMEKKIKAAESLGFTVINVSEKDPIKEVYNLTNGQGADAVIIAVGNTKANEQAMEMVKKFHGRILYFAAGYPAPEMNVDSNIIHYKKIELIGTYGADMKDFFKAAKLLNERFVDVSKLVEKKYKLEDIQEAYKAASTPGSFRVSVLL